MRRILWYSIGIMVAILTLAGCSIDIGPSVQNGSALPPKTPTLLAGSTLEHQAAQAVFQAINRDRTASGLPALQWSDALAGGARKHNMQMQTSNQLAHQLLQEPDLGTRVTQDEVSWAWVGENIGETSEQTTAGALTLHTAMMAEKPPDDGHRQNILTQDGTMLGVDVLLDNTHQKLWLTEDFAKA